MCRTGQSVLLTSQPLLHPGLFIPREGCILLLFIPPPNRHLTESGEHKLQMHLGIDGWKTKSRSTHRQNTEKVFLLCLHRLTLWPASSSPCPLLSGSESTYILVKPAPRSGTPWPPFWAFILLCFALVGEYKTHKF